MKKVRQKAREKITKINMKNIRGAASNHKIVDIILAPKLAGYVSVLYMYKGFLTL